MKLPDASVYDPQRQVYRYFALGRTPTQAISLEPPSQLGWTTSQALRDLPSDAAPVGEGEAPIGELMNPAPRSSQAFTLLLLAGALYFLLR